MQYKGGFKETEGKEKKKITEGYSESTAKKKTSKKAKTRRRKQAAKTPKSKSKADDPKSVNHHILPCAHYSICIHLVQTGNPRACARIPKSVNPRVPKESRGRPLDMCMFFVWLPRVFISLPLLAEEIGNRYKEGVRTSDTKKRTE